MLTHVTTRARGPHIILLHWLGGSARSWQWVASELAAYGYRVTALDLPGFGDSAPCDASNITTSLEQILTTVRALRQGEVHAPWLLCGHSMGGKFASLVARAALDGDPALQGLRGLFLVSPSPPSPEPMSEKKREQLIETLGNPELPAAAFREAADQFVDDNIGEHPLAAEVLQSALRDLERCSRPAFRAWLTTGSKEDWSAHVGALQLPAVLFAGNKEGPLGAKEQVSLAGGYLPQATIVTAEGGGHLTPLERPAEVADRIADFAAELGLQPESAAPALSAEFRQLLDSNATSPQTRAVMEARLQPTPPPTTFTPDEMLTLRALLRVVIPKCSPGFAPVVATKIADATTGWRFDDLPAGLDAWKRGLRSLEHAARDAYAVPFTALDPSSAEELLHAAGSGKLSRNIVDAVLPGEEHSTLSADQMQHWMEDVRGECAKLYVADPRTMDRMGFHGFADNHGFTHIRLEEQA